MRTHFGKSLLLVALGASGLAAQDAPMDTVPVRRQHVSFAVDTTVTNSEFLSLMSDLVEATYPAWASVCSPRPEPSQYETKEDVEIRVAEELSRLLPPIYALSWPRIVRVTVSPEDSYPDRVEYDPERTALTVQAGFHRTEPHESDYVERHLREAIEMGQQLPVLNGGGLQRSTKVEGSIELHPGGLIARHNNLPRQEAARLDVAERENLAVEADIRLAPPADCSWPWPVARLIHGRVLASGEAIMEAGTVGAPDPWDQMAAAMGGTWVSPAASFRVASLSKRQVVLVLPEGEILSGSILSVSPAGDKVAVLPGEGASNSAPVRLELLPVGSDGVRVLRVTHGQESVEYTFSRY